MEYHSVYNTRCRPTLVSSVRTSSLDEPKSSDTYHHVIRPPPGLESNPESIASLDNPSQIDLNSGDTTLVEALPSLPTPHSIEVFNDSSQLDLHSGEATLLEQPPAAPASTSSQNFRTTLQRLGVVPSASFPDLRDSRRYMQITEAQGPRSHSGSIVNDTSSDESESESDDCHFGDGMPPRNPERSTIARARDGSRRVWMITPGRPQMKPLEMEQTVFLRGGAGLDDDDDVQPDEEMSLVPGTDRIISSLFPVSRLPRPIHRIRQRVQSGNYQRTATPDIQIQKTSTNEVLSPPLRGTYEGSTRTLINPADSATRNCLASAGVHLSQSTARDDLERTQEPIVRAYPQRSCPVSVVWQSTQRMDLDGARLYSLPYPNDTAKAHWLTFPRHEDSLRRTERFTMKAFSKLSNQISGRIRARSLSPTRTGPSPDRYEGFHLRPDLLFPPQHDADVHPEGSA